MKQAVALLISMIFLSSYIIAQPCDSNYFSITYTAKAKTAYKKCVATAANGVIAIGNLFYPRGWITKMTNQGSIIWSKGYNADYKGNNEHTFNTPELMDAAPSSASSYIITGTIKRDWDYILNGENLPPPVMVGIISNVDQSGNVLWSRELISRFSTNQAGPWTFCTNAFTLRNGDIIVYLATDKFIHLNKPSYGKIVCFTPNGTLKWQVSLNTGSYETSGVTRYMQRAFTQTRKGNIILADGICKRDFKYSDSAVYTSYAMHFLSFNPSDGSMVWERSYEYSTTAQGALTWFKNITELPDGRLSFITQLGTSASGTQPYQYSPVNIITDAEGRLIKTIAYQAPNASYILNDAKNDDNSGIRTLLFTNSNNGSATLVHIDAEGKIIWNKGYGNTSRHYPPVCFSTSGTGYTIFFSDNEFNSYENQVIITDAGGNAACANTDANVVAEEAKWLYIPDSVHTINAEDYDGFSVLPFAIASEEFSLNKTVDCQKFTPCCADFIDTVHIKEISICEGDSYLLPDERKVSVAGRYDVSFTTPYGCDSTVFVDIRSYKKPADLLPVADTCLGNNDSVTINVTKGFDVYNWMNTTTTKPSFDVHSEGIYYINVNNYCGSKTDTFQVYQECNYPIYMPSAFTPNNDGLNDVFRVPPQNKNRLVSLKIYDRFGQMIFSTTNQQKGWDGYVNSHPADAGTYVYLLQMRGITGKPVSKKGVLTLIR